MTKFTVNVPVWQIYHIEAGTKEDAIELAANEKFPYDVLGMEDVCTEVNEDA